MTLFRSCSLLAVTAVLAVAADPMTTSVPLSGTAAGSTPAPIPVAGSWFLVRTAVVVRTDDRAPQLKDPGISEAAKAIVAGRMEGLQPETHSVPGSWDTWGGDWRSVDGEVVYWRTVTVPDPGDKDWQLDLGSIDDLDTVWVNGVQVGSTDASAPGYWARPRRYRVPAGTLTAGDNRVVVRVFDQVGNGGLTGPAQAMVLKPRP